MTTEQKERKPGEQEAGVMPRNAGSLLKLEKARKWIVP